MVPPNTPTADCLAGAGKIVSNTEKRDAGAGAAAASAPSHWRSLLLRAVLGGVAILGLSAIGAGSILLGLDGAHASPPTSGSAAATGSARTPELPSPLVSSSSSASQVYVAASADVRAPPDNCPARTDDGRVILNLAGAEDLRRIPGIGPKRAEAILQLRAKLKRFKRASDLLRVRGIGPKSLARMQTHFVLDPPPGTACSLPPQAPR